MELMDPFPLVPGITVMLAALFLVATRHWHGRYSADAPVGIQKFHSIPTPRVGGIAIAAGLLTALLISRGPETKLLAPMILAGLPAFMAGLIEDLSRKAGVRERFLATMASGILAFFLTGSSLYRIGLPAADALLAIVPVSVFFTAFAVAGVANAVNIIDGFNGLSSGTLVICFSGLGFIALNAGDQEMAGLSFLLAVVAAGFLVVNFPFGRIFLGDGGAYLLGFLLAWSAVTVTVRNPSVSAWAPLLVCAYPVIETLFTILRRALSRAHPGHADCAHMHSLIKLHLVRRHFHALPQHIRNSMVSPFCWSFALLTTALGIHFYESTELLLASFLGCFVLYTLAYRLITWYGTNVPPPLPEGAQN
jgi:UDP-N-acetylmuramyl pentapeptide phosphotransferase/UDP-N-acetylglucosamine-1-phosphate transferase